MILNITWNDVFSMMITTAKRRRKDLDYYTDKVKEELADMFLKVFNYLPEQEQTIKMKNVLMSMFDEAKNKRFRRNKPSDHLIREFDRLLFEL